jgi:hypothetical protein
VTAPTFQPRAVLTAVALAAVLAAVGCGHSNAKVTHENYEKITPEMSLADVEGILGKGSETTDVSDFPASRPAPGAKIYEWKNSSAVIKVSFQDGKMGARFYRSLKK